PPGDEAEGLLPGDPGEPLPPPPQGGGEPILMAEELQGSIPLGAEGPLADGMARHVLHPDGFAPLHRNEKTAACTAIGADRWNKHLGHLDPRSSRFTSDNTMQRSVGIEVPVGPPRPGGEPDEPRGQYLLFGHLRLGEALHEPGDVLGEDRPVGFVHRRYLHLVSDLGLLDGAPEVDDAPVHPGAYEVGVVAFAREVQDDDDPAGHVLAEEVLGPPADDEDGPLPLVLLHVE